MQTLEPNLQHLANTSSVLLKLVYSTIAQVTVACEHLRYSSTAAYTLVRWLRRATSNAVLYVTYNT
jgi:hypothetical protein